MSLRRQEINVLTEQKMEPLIIQKQIFQTSESRDFILLTLFKVILSVFILIAFGIIGNQVYKGNREIADQMILPLLLGISILIFNKISPFKMFEF
jgi:hypothetical protein